MDETLDFGKGIELLLAGWLPQEGTVDLALLERKADGGEVRQEAHEDGVDAGASEVVGSVRVQGRLNRSDGVDAVRTSAHGKGVEGGFEEAGCIEPLQQMLGEDADGGETGEERGVRGGQAKDDGAQIGRPHLDAGPGRDQAGVAAEAGSKDLPDRERHVEGADGGAVVPAEVGVEAEGVGTPVLADLGEGGEVGEEAAVVSGAQQAGEHEAGEVLIHGVVGGEEGVDALGDADDALDVDVSLGGGLRGKRLGGPHRRGGEGRRPGDWPQAHPPRAEPQSGGRAASSQPRETWAGVNSATERSGRTRRGKRLRE